MARIEILVEEPSMKEFLNILLPKILDKEWILNENYFIRSFEGKSDLQKNIPSKVKLLSNWNHEASGIVIMQDQDSSDCKILKKKLLDICDQNGNCPKLVRIVCRELESWYIGDFLAVNKAYPNFKHQNYINKSKFRVPDNCNAFDELKKILPEFQKVGGAKKIAPFITIDGNTSESFQQTVNGLKRFFNTIKD
ncbi:protein of unknown function [Flavobacterium succinicans]|jgi:hypothetical protein|uniref:DUF4276 family protein n=1 Tax=Flavobacterium succinicans TaxID=29536 RepID=A0A1I4R1I8_9FLAO|nr:DUF4276 family protein [Flavobacterium succinicans]TAF68990.1 MAG: DUF4276 family protein [Flavobacterium sp.]SFM46149.1 protein of unknown function [Flavobacterium succinicans]